MKEKMKAGKEYLENGAKEKLAFVQEHHEELIALYKSTVAETEQLKE